MREKRNSARAGRGCRVGRGRWQGTDRGKDRGAGRRLAGGGGAISGALGFLGRLAMERIGRRPPDGGGTGTVYGRAGGGVAGPSGTPPEGTGFGTGDPKPYRAKACVAPERCVGCGLCAELCPAGAITLGEVALVDITGCTGCGRCVPECPVGALTLERAGGADR